MGGEGYNFTDERTKNISIYGLSPNQQKAFPNFGKEVMKESKRLGKFLLGVGPFIFTTWYIIQWGNEKNRQLHRKKPEDFLPGAAHPSH